MKGLSVLLRSTYVIGLAAVGMLLAMPESYAQSLDPALPPLSAPKAEFFRNNPAAWSQYLSQLPRRPANTAVPTTPRALPPAGGTWEDVTEAPVGVCNPLLLTDGTVIVSDCGAAGAWYKLTPDINGNYVTGTWSSIASLPSIGGTQYAPLYFSSAVLPDGRVIIMGGEYNLGTEVFTDLGAIYDPTTNKWKAVSAPGPSSTWTIGDAQSIVLADGTFMLGACCSNPDVDALFNATTLGWTATGAPSAGGAYQDEQGYELLPNGNVLTIDLWTNQPNGNATNAEQYVPSSGTWISAGNTPVPLGDPFQCGNWEIGPAALRPNGTLVAFGGNTGCPGVPSTDPTAIYNSTSGTWSAGPNIPAVCGSNGKTRCTLADAPAVVLPSGSILFAASTGYTAAGPYGNPPTHFFEFSSANAITQVADTLNFAHTSASYYYNFLVLPNGQILCTDLSNFPEIYTPTGTPNTSWAPVISSAPSTVAIGSSYAISGTQFNGLSQGAYYGDDVQGWTNYPIAQITNTATSHVFYARTFNHSTMSIAPGGSGATNFTVPATTETGASTLVVIANGIASAPVSINVTTGQSNKPAFTLVPTSLPFGSQKLNVASASKPVKVTNTGNVALPVSTIAVSGTQFSQTNTCGASVAVGGTCTINVVFKPTVKGPITATLYVDLKGAGTQTVALSGSGTAPSYTLAPTSLAFGDQTVDVASAAKPVTVTNTGNVALPVGTIAVSGTQFSQTNTCGTSVAVGASCKINVVFKPTETGPITATLYVDLTGAGTQTAPLSGTGVAGD